MKIAAAVILYHPHSSFFSNIKTYYSYIDKIYVFDNTETGPTIGEESRQLSKVEFFHDHKNDGIAKRLNAGAEKAIRDGYQWLLTMDQDSYFDGESFRTYINCFNKFTSKENVALFGTRYGRQGNLSSEICTPAEIHELITSGTLVNLSLYKKVGPFDEALFIDSVDHDYCIRAKNLGLSLIEFSNIYLSHELGTHVYKSSIKTFFLVKKTKAIQSPLRCYYMYRNLLYLEKKYKGMEVPLLKSVRSTVISNIMNSIYYGRSTFKILKYLSAARNDFKKMKMGKIVNGEW